MADSTSHPPAACTLDMLSGTVVCKRVNGATCYGVAHYQAGTDLPHVFQVTYVHGATELLSEAELHRTKVSTWADVPTRYHTTLKRRLQGRMRLARLATATAGPPDAYHKLVVRKKFASAWCYGVATYLPAEQPPYTYQVTYHDGDLETFMPQTVQRMVVRTWEQVPAFVHGLLQAMGGQVLVAGDTLPTPEHPQSIAHTANPTVPAPQSEGAMPAPDRAARAAARTRRRRAVGLRRAAAQACHQAGVKLAFINPCGLTQLKAAELHHAMVALGIDVLGVAETWQGRCTPATIPSYTFIGKPRAGGQGGGVGFYVSNTLTPLTTVHTNTSAPESMWLEIHRRVGSHTRNIFLGLVYLPPSALSTAQLAMDAYAQVTLDVQRFQALGEVVLMGDFNSRVGMAAQPLQRVGQWGETTTDAAGQALLDMLAATNMYTLNGRTANPNPETHVPEYTRMRCVQRADGTMQQQCAVLDYIMASQSMVLPRGSGSGLPSCQLHVEQRWQPTGADHLLLWCCIPYKPPTHTSAQHVRHRPAVQLLTRPCEQRAYHVKCYQAAVEEALHGYAAHVHELQHQAEQGYVNEAVAVATAKAQLCECIHTAVANSIGYRAPTTRRGCHPATHVYTREVRAAVRERQQAAAAVVQAHADTSATPTDIHAAQTTLAAATANVKSVVKGARQQLHDRQVSAVYECAARNDGKGMWRALKQLGTGSPRQEGPAALKQSDGTMVMDNQRVADLLAAQFQSATNADAFQHGAGFDDQHKQAVEADVATLRSHTSYADSGEECLSAPILAGEVYAQCARLQNWKSPSPKDDVNNELLKYGGSALVAALTVFYDMQFQLETKSQTPGVIKALHKKEDPTLASNYRPITLGSSIDKLYNSVLSARICELLERTAALHEAQQGFRQGRSAVDNIFMLTQCLSARMHAKLDTYVLFLDIEKAYDSVWRAGLLWHVWNKGIKGKMFRVLAQMTDSPTSCVLHKGAYSATFQPDMGWEQGDTLATTMFNIHVDAVLQEVWAQHEGVPLPHLQADEPDKLTALMYADDLSALAGTPAALQRLIDLIRAALTKWRLKASVKPSDGSKTAVMVVRGGSKAARLRAARAGLAQSGTWTWGDVIVPQVAAYCYLGAWLSHTGTWDEHLQQRLHKADAAAHVQRTVMQNTSLPWQLRKLSLVSAVQPVLTYACQVWCNTTDQTRKLLDGWQAKRVKSMVHCPPNASIECIRRELGILPLHMACDMWMLTYWHHLRSTPTDRLLHQVFTAWSGPANPWQANVDKLLAEYDICAEDADTLHKTKFVEYVRGRLLHKLHAGEGSARHEGGAVFQRYKHHYGVGASDNTKPAAQGYINTLSHLRRGWAAELCMKLRAECLQLRAVTSHNRRQESVAARTMREKCPACKQAAETAHHFLLECPVYAATRVAMMDALRAHAPQQLAAVQSASPETAWRLLLADAMLGKGPILQRHRPLMPHGITCWMEQQMQRHNHHGMQPLAQQPLELQRQQQQQQQQRQWPSPMEAIATYVVDAWKMRSAALNGRETNGGDPMV
jgi:hypothetical protein